MDKLRLELHIFPQSPEMTKSELFSERCRGNSRVFGEEPNKIGVVLVIQAVRNFFDRQRCVGQKALTFEDDSVFNDVVGGVFAK